jgi:hypothetical protein
MTAPRSLAEAPRNPLPRGGRPYMTWVWFRVLAAHCVRGLLDELPALLFRGRREDRVRAAPAVSRAIAHRERAHEHTGSAETLRPSLRNGFTAYFELSPVNGSFATVAAQDMNLAQLNASTAASGPHDFAVRFRRVRLAPFTSIASHRTFVTMANAPHPP